MALLFSAVTVTAGEDEVELLVGGIPREYADSPAKIFSRGCYISICPNGMRKPSASLGKPGGLQRKRRPGKSNGSGTGGSPSEWERKICRRMKGTSRWYSQAGKS